MALSVDDCGLIYDAANRPPAERIAFFTNLAATREGVLFAAGQVGASKHAVGSTIKLFRSRDGALWSELPATFDTTCAGLPGSLAGPSLVEAEPGRLLLLATWFDRSDPQRPLFDPVTEGILHSRQLLAESVDDGAVWTAWRELPTPGLTGCSSTGPVVRWADGALAYAFESFKEFDDPRPARHAAQLMVSRDGGRSFSSPLLVAQDPRHEKYYWDQRLCPTSRPGEFVAMFWTHDRRQRRDLRVHWLRSTIDAPQPRPLPAETSIPGQIAAPLWLDDSRLFAFVVDRDQAGTMTLWLSTDGGASWSAESRLVVHRHCERAKLSQGRQDIHFAQYWEDMGKWSFGHPALLVLPDNRLLAAWYAGTPDSMSLHFARVRIDR
jgi:hypothetical protein